MTGFTEKPPLGSTEPLVLRPPVGSEMRDNVYFRTLLPRSDVLMRRKRFLCHFLLSTLLALVSIAMLLCILFVLGVNPMFGHGRSHPHYAYRQDRDSSCRIFIPRFGLHLQETLSSFMDNSMLARPTEQEDHQDMDRFNVTVSNAKTRLSILHVCTDGLTVIRTADRCFIRPMNADWRRVCMNAELRQMMNEAPKSVEARFADEFWFANPFVPVPKTIHNSFILNWCDGVPAYRLVSRPPTDGYLIVTAQETTADSATQPQQPVIIDEQHVVTGAPEQAGSGTAQDEVLDLVLNRKVVSVSPVPEDKQSSSTSGALRRSQRSVSQPSGKKCTEESTIVEDAPILNGRSGPITIPRDHILFC